MTDPRFLFLCAPSNLAGTPAGWAREMLEEGEVALLGAEGIEAVDALAHDLGQVTIALLRSEQTGERQLDTVIEFAGGMPLIWISGTFGDRARQWAHDRGPMTLLSETAGQLGDDERRRIDRFVAMLGRQSE